MCLLFLVILNIYVDVIRVRMRHPWMVPKVDVRVCTFQFLYQYVVQHSSSFVTCCVGILRNVHVCSRLCVLCVT